MAKKSIQIRVFNSFASERSRVRIPSGPPKINHPQGWLYFCCGPRDSRFMPRRGKSLQVHQKPPLWGGFSFRPGSFGPALPQRNGQREKRRLHQRRHHTGGILPPAEGVLKKQRGRTYMGSPPLINVYFTRVPEQQRFFAAAKQHRLFDQAHFFRYCFIISPRMGIQRAMSSSPVVEKFSRMAFLPLPSQQKN